MSFWVLLRMEGYKLLRRGRSYIGPGGLLAIVLATAVALKYGEFGRNVDRFMGSDLNVYGSPFNALFLARTVLPPTVMLFMPLFVSLIAGDQISGEAGDGTLRAVLSRPVSRLKLLAAKFVVSVFYAVGLAAFLGLAAFFIGWALFGTGALVSFGGGLKYFGMAEGLHRLVLSYGIAAVAMVAVVGISVLLSVFSSNSLAPVGGTIAILVVSSAVGQLPFFDRAKPFLFTTYLDLFQRAFDVPVDPVAIWKGVGVLCLWAASGFVLASLVFARKDILT